MRPKRLRSIPKQESTKEADWATLHFLQLLIRIIISSNIINVPQRGCALWRHALNAMGLVYAVSVMEQEESP